MKCPKCSVGMEQVTYSGYEIDRCTDCKGLWFQIAEFEALIEDDWLAGFIDSGSKPRKRKADGAGHVSCPDCGTKMAEVVDEKQPHIVYERCPKDCGAFFDAGEFKDLAHKSFWDKFKPRAKITS